MHTQNASDISLNHMFARLRAAKTQPLPPQLERRISKSMLNGIIDAILNNVDLRRKALLLKPSSALYFSKDQTKLERSFKIARKPDGKYICVLETKSKNNKNRKQKIQVYGGGYKTGKDAWRIDGKIFKPYVSLQILLANAPKNLARLSAKLKNAIEKAKREVLFPWQFEEKKYFHRSLLGPVYNNKKGLNVNILSRKKTTLKDAMRTLTKAQKDSITLQLLEGLEYIHEKGYIHQDINPSNILISFDENKQVHAKYNDFGGTVQHHEKAVVFGTIGYESPEVAAASNLRDFPYRSYYQKHYKKYGPTLAKKLSLDFKFKKETKKEFLKAHPANDVWALGVTLFTLYCKQKPKALPTSPLLAALLNPNREHRITAPQARVLWQSMNQRNEESAISTYCLRPAKTFTLGFFNFISSASTHLKALVWGDPQPETDSPQVGRYSQNL